MNGSENPAGARRIVRDVAHANVLVLEAPHVFVEDLTVASIRELHERQRPRRTLPTASSRRV